MRHLHGAGGHYSLTELHDMTEVKQLLPDPVETDWRWELNWLFVGTSGVHGSYTAIPEVDPESPYLTVLIVRPRSASLAFGHVKCEPEDLEWLQRALEFTLRGIVSSQLKSLPADLGAALCGVLPALGA